MGRAGEVWLFRRSALSSVCWPESVSCVRCLSLCLVRPVGSNNTCGHLSFKCSVRLAILIPFALAINIFRVVDSP